MGLTTEAPCGPELQATRDAVIRAALGLVHAQLAPLDIYRDQVIDLREMALDQALAEWARLTGVVQLSQATTAEEG